MKLAIVTGQIVCTVRHQGLAHDKLLMVEMIDAQGNPDGQCAVAIDSIGAGTGEWVLLVSGSSARQARSRRSGRRASWSARRGRHAACSMNTGRCV